MAIRLGAQDAVTIAFESIDNGRNVAGKWRGTRGLASCAVWAGFKDWAAKCRWEGGNNRECSDLGKTQLTPI